MSENNNKPKETVYPAQSQTPSEEQAQTSGPISSATPGNSKIDHLHFDPNLQQELDQIEFGVETLTNNFRNRRLSKNELDFLETELNLDIDAIGDSEFDLHIQKLIADNDSNNNNNNNNSSNIMLTSSLIPNKHVISSNSSTIKKSESTEIRQDKSIQSKDPITEEKKRIQVKSPLNNQIESSAIIETNNSEISKKVDDSKTDDHEVEKQSNKELDDLKKNQEEIKNSSDKSQVQFGKDVTTESKEQVKSITPELNVSNDISNKENIDLKHVLTEKVNDNQVKEIKITKSNSEISSNSTTPAPVNNQQLEIAETSTKTNYKGVSIPSNSELFKTDETENILKAYRDLLEGSEDNQKPVSVINAQLAALPLTITAPDHLSFNIQLLINTLPVLDNLSTQILRIISRGPYKKVMELVSNRESYSGIAFSNLIELFETTKRVYNSEESPFFTVENVTFGLWKYGQSPPIFLRGREDTIESTLRKVNLSTFLLATLGLIDLGFFFLNEAFLDVFCPPQNLDPSDSLSYLKQDNTLQSSWSNSKLNNSTSKLTKTQRHQTKFLKAQAILYLELKTQAYISAIELGDRSKEEIIQDLFPNDMDEILLRRKDPFFDPTKSKIERNSTLFTPAELDFLNRCDSRKQKLLETKNDDSLMEIYEWIKFLNDLLDYVSKNVGFLIWGPKGKISIELDKFNNSNSNSKNLNLNINRFKKENLSLDNSQNISMSDKKNINNHEMTSNSINNNAINDENENNKKRKLEFKNSTPNNESVQDVKPIKKQRQNRPSTFRRTWTPEEEETLREGLKLKGTHWTAILELFGPGGKINEKLKNRSSLQLKDKARNWKMYYLKNNLEVPDYLQKATGDMDKIKQGSSDSGQIKRPKTGSRISTIQTSTNRPAVNDANVNSNNESTAISGTSANAEASYDALISDFFTDKESNKEKQSSTQSEGVAVEDAAANELKDLVAEAFK